DDGVDAEPPPETGAVPKPGSAPAGVATSRTVPAAARLVRARRRRNIGTSHGHPGAETPRPRVPGNTGEMRLRAGWLTAGQGGSASDGYGDMSACCAGVSPRGITQVEQVSGPAAPGRGAAASEAQEPGGPESQLTLSAARGAVPGGPTPLLAAAGGRRGYEDCLAS